MDDRGTRMVADRYALQEVIGSGGGGAVWRAEDTVLGRRVAVKQVRISSGDPARLRARVLREARAAARLHHPAATAVYDVVEAEDTVHIVMELVDGPSLAEHVRAAGPLAPAEAAAMGLAVLGALEAAHAQGVVHRDVKPGNVLLSPDGPKLTDFGIAAVDDDPSLTVTGTILGSPSFMSPEQAQGRGVTPASDLWGLGALLHFSVEGSGPFDRSEALPTLAAVVGEPPAVPQRAGALTPAIVALLVKDPLGRAAPADLRALLAEAASAPVGLRDPAAGRSAVGGGAGPVRSPRDPAGEEPSRLAPLLVALIALALLGAAAVWALRDAPGGEVVAPAPAPTAAEPAEPTLTPDAPEPTGEPEGTSPPEPTATPAPVPTVERTPEAAGGPPTPEGFARAAIGPAGASVAHPEGWQEEVVSATVVDHRDPDSSTYLRTDWTDSPAPDPVADWEQQSAAFAQRQDEYTEVRIEPTTLAGHEGAIWEYTYRSGDAELHAVNVAVVTGPYAYAVNVQSASADWADLQPTVEAILASFDPGETG